MIGRKLMPKELSRSLSEVVNYVEVSLMHDCHTHATILEQYRNDKTLGHVVSRLSMALRDASLAIKNASDAVSPETRAKIAAM